MRQQRIIISTIVAILVLAGLIYGYTHSNMYTQAVEPPQAVEPQTAPPLVADDDGKTPPPPVESDKVLGYWEDDEGERAYAHVEDDMASAHRFATENQFTLTLTDGRAMKASCIGNVMSQPGTEAKRLDYKNCSPLLVLGQWYRVNMGDLEKNWGFDVSYGEQGNYTSYRIDAVCDANGNCQTFEEAGRQGLAKIEREQDEEAKRRPGYNAKKQLDTIQP